MSIFANKTPISFNTDTKGTRPQTALTQTRSAILQISEPTDDASKLTIHRYTNPTSLTPRSLKRLQEQRRGDAHSMNLRVTKDLAEIEAPEDYFAKEIELNKDDYDKFKKNFDKIVFDAFGNYLYTRPDPQRQDQKLQVSGALSQKTNSQNLKRKLMLKTQSFQPRKIIESLVKNSQEIASMNPRRKNILDIKQKAEAALSLMINNVAKDKIMAESKSQLQSATMEMLNEVDKFLRENQVLQDQIEQVKNHLLELQSANESLNFKNQQLQKELKLSKSALDEIKRGSVDLEKFIPEFKILSKKFPGLSAEKVLDRYEYFENAVMTLTKKVGEMEQDKYQQEKLWATNRKDYEMKLQDLTLYKQEIPFVNSTLTLEQELKEAKQYKDQYTILFNKILEIYLEWSSKTKAFLPDKQDTGPKSKLVDPLEMLQLMEKMIKISSSEKLQDYLRKIIVSANLLQRKYMPDNVNLKFDPDKIYDRITKLVDNLNAQILKLQRQVSVYTLKTGIKPEDEKLDQSKSYIREDLKITAKN